MSRRDPQLSTSESRILSDCEEGRAAQLQGLLRTALQLYANLYPNINYGELFIPCLFFPLDHRSLDMRVSVFPHWLRVVGRDKLPNICIPKGLITLRGQKF